MSAHLHFMLEPHYWIYWCNVTNTNRKIFSLQKKALRSNDLDLFCWCDLSENQMKLNDKPQKKKCSVNGYRVDLNRVLFVLVLMNSKQNEVSIQSVSDFKRKLPFCNSQFYYKNKSKKFKQRKYFHHWFEEIHQNNWNFTIALTFFVLVILPSSQRICCTDHSTWQKINIHRKDKWNGRLSYADYSCQFYGEIIFQVLCLVAWTLVVDMVNLLIGGVLQVNRFYRYLNARWIENSLIHCNKIWIWLI